MILISMHAHFLFGNYLFDTNTITEPMLYTEFLIEYYEYSFDYLTTIMNKSMINTHT